jgi:hypothetical protein
MQVFIESKHGRIPMYLQCETIANEHIEVLVKNNKAEQRRSGIDQIVSQLWLSDYDCFWRHRFPIAPVHTIAQNMIAHAMDFHHQILMK